MTSKVARTQPYRVGDTISKAKLLPRPRTLTELVAGLHIIFEDNDIEVEDVKSYLSSYVAKDEEWKHLAKFDPHSCIHDHSDAHCFMKVLQGDLTETKFEWPENDQAPMIPCGNEYVQRDEVAYINDSIGLHRVGNSSESPACSLHLYSPPFQDCQTFDQKSGHKVRCHVTFHTKFGEKVCYVSTVSNN
ncbi:cysteine dioxygenase type 1-like isoform X2 [Ciona intestinalis]